MRHLSRALLALAALAACRTPAVIEANPDLVFDPDAEIVPNEVTEDPAPEAETPAPTPEGDSAAPEEVIPDVPCDVLTEWVQMPFTFPADALSCTGDQAVTFDATYGLFVGVVFCGDGFVRVYLSEGTDGPFLPAMDLAGHGQDHCELLAPGFTLPNEDDITSGGCPACATSRNLPLEGVAGWARPFLGDAFTFYDPTGEWSWQTSRINCDVDPVVCVP